VADRYWWYATATSTAQAEALKPPQLPDDVACAQNILSRTPSTSRARIGESKIFVSIVLVPEPHQRPQAQRLGRHTWRMPALCLLANSGRGRKARRSEFDAFEAASATSGPIVIAPRAAPSTRPRLSLRAEHFGSVGIQDLLSGVVRG
jgi:hypothetical protein